MLRPQGGTETGEEIRGGKCTPGRERAYVIMYLRVQGSICMASHTDVGV